MGLRALGGLVGGFVFIRVIDDGGVESKKPMDCGHHCYPQIFCIVERVISFRSGSVCNGDCLRMLEAS